MLTVEMFVTGIITIITFITITFITTIITFITTTAAITNMPDT